MRSIRSLYLAGPQPWLPDPARHMGLQRALCDAAGLIALLPDEGGLLAQEPSEIVARQIYAARMAAMRQADAGVIDLTPWRGPSADPGAAFEAGVLSGLVKPVFAYMNITVDDDADLATRLSGYVGVEIGEDGEAYDQDGCRIEDFGLPETLMLWAEARRLFIVVTDDPLRDLTGLQLCLEAIRQYAG
ncbi:nucleoside 2-deoxyribosyltransferase [Caulobacter segnis]|uniref:nucleoside 2-deoxyribosyltransferase n=1 Tax=Caulobacter segnis TaxID=88688 RepID=UPI00240FF51B|nr:nucleoside 2-deoxyribosyltransferase [Caulobacter segnis]MDG2522775.1 nucleoside 2-deoxyribosyltransferase [Caulobacter segnis]